MKKMLIFFLACLVFIFLPHESNAVTFSPNDRGINIGTQLDRGYEPSGVVWHNRLQSLFLVWDNGYVTQTDINGNILHRSVRIGGDIEGITVANDQSNFIYLLVEYPQKIVEFDISTWTLTGKQWLLEGMQGNSASGAEALTYNTDKELFYVGSQFDGNIYVYDIDLNISQVVSPSHSITTAIANDIAGLHYSADTKRTYAVFDSANKIQEYDNNDTLVIQYDLPGRDQEGVTLLPGCPNNTTTLVIAEDSGAVMKYTTYPITCPVAEPQPVDNDHDGFPAEADCNDNNAQINSGMVEIQNDGNDNDCNSATADWVRTYNSTTITPYSNTQIREDYHIFDQKNEFSYIRLPGQPTAGWYAFDLEARGTTLDTLYGLGIYVRNSQGRYTKMREINDLGFKTYRYYYYIPANTPTEVRFISNVRGTDPTGAKREHHLKTVTLTRVEEQLFPENTPSITDINIRVGQTKAIVNFTTDKEAWATLTLNSTLMTNTLLSTNKTWTLRNLTCGTTYTYELKLYSDLFNPLFNNEVSQVGNFTTAACS